MRKAKIVRISAVIALAAACGSAFADVTSKTYVDAADNGKADKVGSATAGNLAGFDSSGNLTDSGVSGAIVLTTEHLGVGGGAAVLNGDGKVSSNQLALTDSDLPGASRDASIVHKTGTETIGGDKTFSSALTLPGAPTADLHAATKGYVDGLIGNILEALNAINGN
jgi:hypothetical protein